MSEDCYRSKLKIIKNNVRELLEIGNREEAKQEMLKAINLRIKFENLKDA